MRAQLLNSGYDSEWVKSVESANECFTAVLDEDLRERNEESGTFLQYQRPHSRSRSTSSWSTDSKASWR